MANLVIFICGILFAIGLGISGMTLPQKVIGFLDITGDWDPTLLTVMGGAVMVYGISQWIILKRSAPMFTNNFSLPTRRDIDAPLIMGAVLFGTGWGLAGFCPGPALTTVVTGNQYVLIFVISMITGMYAFGTLHVAGSNDPDGGAGGWSLILGKR